jgi:hypothetical protein
VDTLGHVNNTMYFRYMEQVRIGRYAHRALRVGSSADCASGRPVALPEPVLALLRLANA